jgi:hypothetical protein
MQFVKVFVGPSGWGVNGIQIISCVYLCGVHVQYGTVQYGTVQYGTVQYSLLCCLT